MPFKVVILCHVEPGTVRNGTIIPGFDRPEGIVKTVPGILEFADRQRAPLGFALTAQAVQLLDSDLSGHDEGVHLHPMDPVLMQRLGTDVRPAGDCLGRYPRSAQASLIAAACEIHTQARGRAPRLFVAGRWSEDATTIELLRSQGFTHDASAVPGYRNECADWSHLPRLAQPYSLALSPGETGDSHRIVQIPVYQGLWGHYFTPETMQDLGAAYFKAALKEAQVGGSEVVHMYFHSPIGLDPRAMATFADVLSFARDVLHATFVRPTEIGPSSRREARSFPPAYWARPSWTMFKSIIAQREFGRRIMAGASVEGPLVDET